MPAEPVTQTSPCAHGNNVSDERMGSLCVMSGRSPRNIAERADRGGYFGFVFFLLGDEISELSCLEETVFSVFFFGTSKRRKH